MRRPGMREAMVGLGLSFLGAAGTENTAEARHGHRHKHGGVEHRHEHESEASRAQKIIDRLSPEDLDTLFEGEKEHLATCIDDRILDGTFRMPGSGILQDNLDELAEMLLEKGVTDVSSHEGCGAAAAAHKIISEREGAKPAWFVMESADETGKKFVEEVVRIMNEKKADPEHRIGSVHLKPKEGMLEGPHKAKVGYIDMTGGGFKLREAVRLGMAPGYSTSDMLGDGEYDSAILAAKIAEHHGEHSFEIVILVKDDDEKAGEYVRKNKEAIVKAGLDPKKVTVGVVKVRGLNDLPYEIKAPPMPAPVKSF